MTPAEIKAEFEKEEVKATYNKTPVKDAFIVGYGIMRSKAIPKLGEQLGVSVTNVVGKILTFTPEQLPDISFIEIKELSNLGFSYNATHNRIAYDI